MTKGSRAYRWWRDAPPLARRFYWRVLTPGAVVAVATVVLGLSDGARRLGIGLFVALLIALALAIVGWVYLVARWETALRRQLAETDYKLCPRCRFPLTGHAGATNCPECGTACDVGQVQAAWRAFRPVITSAQSDR